MTLRRILPLITASILIFFASPQPAHAAEIQPGGDPGALLNSAGLATPQLAFGCDMAIGIETTQCGALMDLYTAGMRGVGDTGAAWGTTTTPCSWRGVACAGGYPSQLAFNAPNGGSLPASIGTLTKLESLSILDGVGGALPSGLFDLTNLTNLTIRDNSLGGSLPSNISNLDMLSSLTINNTKIGGGLPSEIGALDRLEYLYLSHNQFSGNIQSLSNTYLSIKEVDLSYNQFEGNINFGSRSTYYDLTKFKANNNLFTGITIPMRSTPNLLVADVSHNRLTIWNIGGTKLTNLAINDNPLTGTVPDWSLSYPDMVHFTWQNTGMCVEDTLSSKNWVMGVSPSLADWTDVTCGTYSASGSVTDADGLPMANVPVMANPRLMTLTDASGNFSFANLPAGSKTFYPSLANYGFLPLSATHTLGPDVTGINFSGTQGKSLVSLIVDEADAPAGALWDGKDMLGQPASIGVAFSGDVQEGDGANGVANAANWMLLAPGDNATFDTQPADAGVCAASHTPAGDDVNVPLGAISYLPASSSVPASVGIAMAAPNDPLPLGDYRLYMCANIWDIAGLKVNDGQNQALGFTVLPEGGAPTATSTVTATATASPTATISPTPTLTSKAKTATPTTKPKKTATPTPQPKPSKTPAGGPTRTPTITPTPSVTVEPTTTNTPPGISELWREDFTTSLGAWSQQAIAWKLDAGNATTKGTCIVDGNILISNGDDWTDAIYTFDLNAKAKTKSSFLFRVSGANAYRVVFSPGASPSLELYGNNGIRLASASPTLPAGKWATYRVDSVGSLVSIFQVAGQDLLPLLSFDDPKPASTVGKIGLRPLNSAACGGGVRFDNVRVYQPAP